ncbi:MAG: hypothetical protein V3V08_06470 [Nannocystaceae bacterium]
MDGYTREVAHVPRPEGLESPRELRSMTSAELDRVDPAYIQWLNPSDYRVVSQTCGTPACHAEISQTAPSSIMTTFAGHFNKTRYYAGVQADRAAQYGIRSQVDASFTGAAGSVASLAQHSAPPLDERSSVGDYLDHYLENGCPGCHVWNYGPNDRRGDFRSSGCAGCHLVYDNDGLSRSSDPTANRDDPPHPAKHRLTTAIPDSQCEHCHYRGNRIGTMFRGIRESARLGDPPHLGVVDQALHGHAAGFYVEDEDTTNSVDETPPDLHHAAGLGCVDCHMGVDVHGDGQLYSAHDYQVGIECEDCHGTPDAAIRAGADGYFRTTRGDPMRAVQTDDKGRPILLGRLDGQVHRLTQLRDLQARSDNLELIFSHGRTPEGFSHLDSLECYACHTAWTQSCFGCHVTIDGRSTTPSLIDGSPTARSRGSRSWVAMDYFALGIGTDGKITPMAPQEKMFVTAIAPCDPELETCTEGVDSATPGKRVHDRSIRRTVDGKLGFGFGPVVPHTTSSGVQPCDRCHLREDESNWPILNETLGRGSGRFQIPDGEGKLYDLTQVVDDTGQTIVGLAHQGTDVLPLSIVEHMLAPRVGHSGLKLRPASAWVTP